LLRRIAFFALNFPFQIQIPLEAVAFQNLFFFAQKIPSCKDWLPAGSKAAFFSVSSSLGLTNWEGVV